MLIIYCAPFTKFYLFLETIDNNCVICNLSLGEGITRDLTEKGKSSIFAVSLQRGDEKYNI